MTTTAAPILQLEIKREPARTVVHCTGNIVIESWPEFSVRVRELIPEGKPIRVDLSKVPMVDSSGIGACVSVWAAAKKRGCDLKFIHPNERILDLVRITELHDLFEIRPRKASSA